MTEGRLCRRDARMSGAGCGLQAGPRLNGTGNQKKDRFISQTKGTLFMEEKLLMLFAAEFPDVDFTSSDKLIDDGILDSMTITSMVALMTLELGIEIPYEEITAENFNSISALAALVEDLS